MKKFIVLMLCFFGSLLMSCESLTVDETASSVDLSGLVMLDEVYEESEVVISLVEEEVYLNTLYETRRAELQSAYYNTDMSVALADYYLLDAELVSIMDAITVNNDALTLYREDTMPDQAEDFAETLGLSYGVTSVFLVYDEPTGQVGDYVNLTNGVISLFEDNDWFVENDEDEEDNDDDEQEEVEEVEVVE